MNLTCCMCAMVEDIRRGRALGATLVSLLMVTLCSPALGQAAEDPDEVGEWNEPPCVDPDPDCYTWPLRAIHAAHLPSERILVWDFGDGDPEDPPPQLWNPTDGSFSVVKTGVDFPLYCSGHAGLADGSLLVAGGGPHAGVAQDEAIIFLLTGLGPWKQVASMNSTRWYPTLTTLPNGRVLATSGSNPFPVPIPEIYNPLAVGPIGTLGAWSNVPNNPYSPYKELFNYPFMFVLPQENEVFFARAVHNPLGADPEEHRETYTLDVATGQWTFVDLSPFTGKFGSAVMYEPGKVLKCGGLTEGPTENETAIIDLNDQTPMWESIIPGMTAARRHHNLVLLPTGRILAIGGSKNLGADPVLAAEWFDPNDPFLPQWEGLAMMTRPRAGHSTAVLLRDGRVLA